METGKTCSCFTPTQRIGIDLDAHYADICLPGKLQALTVPLTRLENARPAAIALSVVVERKRVPHEQAFNCQTCMRSQDLLHHSLLLVRLMHVSV